MPINIEIDQGSGFCFGVTRAIGKAEEELRADQRLYCLGDIVHNEQEVARLAGQGLVTIGHDSLSQLPRGSKVLLRAHGEPPSTYREAASCGLQVVDATCPVVLRLQKHVSDEYHAPGQRQIVIFGKRGHAEVLGLVGQTDGNAIVLERPSDAAKLDMRHDIRLFSQTTMPLNEFNSIVSYIESHIQSPATFRYFDTVCRQVAGRMAHVQQFARSHDGILFVSGRKSSNGHVLFEACRRVNPHTHLIADAAEIAPEWFAGMRSIGICGATSTPLWLMEACRNTLLRTYGQA